MSGIGFLPLFTLASRLSRKSGECCHLLCAAEEYMLAKAFVVAMAADIARSDYAKPTLIRSRSREWLIACRWGPDGEYLSIAPAGAMLDTRGLAAPGAITPV